MVSPSLNIGLALHMCMLTSARPRLERFSLCLIKTLKLADSSFQQTVRDVNFENWHEVVNTPFFLYLHKDLGIPDKPTMSPHFYYQAAQ